MGRSTPEASRPCLDLASAASYQIVSRDYGVAYDADHERVGQAIASREPLEKIRLDVLAGKVNACFQQTREPLLVEAINYKRADVVAELLKLGADAAMQPTICGDGNSLLMEMVLNGNQDGDAFLEAYLDHGGDPNARIYSWGAPLLVTAVLSDNIPKVRMLLRAGANPWLKGVGRYRVDSAVEKADSPAILGWFPGRGRLSPRPQRRPRRLVCTLEGASSLAGRGAKRHADHNPRHPRSVGLCRRSIDVGNLEQRLASFSPLSRLMGCA